MSTLQVKPPYTFNTPLSQPVPCARRRKELVPAVTISIHDSFIAQIDYIEVLKDIMRDVYKRVLGYIPQVELTSTKLKFRIDEGSSSHSLYEQRARQYLKNKREVPEYPLDSPSIFNLSREGSGVLLGELRKR